MLAAQIAMPYGPLQELALGSYPICELCYFLLFSVSGCFRGRTNFVADRLDLHIACHRSVAALSPTCSNAFLEAKLHTNDATMKQVCYSCYQQRFCYKLMTLPYTCAVTSRAASNMFKDITSFSFDSFDT